VNNGLFDNGIDFVWSNTTIPDRLSRRSVDDDVSRVFVSADVGALENQHTLEVP